MLITIPDVLTADEVRHARDFLSRGKFVDGRHTAAAMANEVKNNLEYQRPEQKMTEIDQLVMSRLMQNDIFQDFALPKLLAPPIFSQYREGMEYGTHVDTPLMGQNGLMRSDLSLTLFLCDPADYDGGELTVETPFGDQTTKLPAGHAVVYQSTSLHRVQPVTRGVRLVALSWVQSCVQDEGIREVLFDLSTASRELNEKQGGEDMKAIKDRLFKAYANLVRRHAEP